jgi:hypothetical protein
MNSICCRHLFARHMPGADRGKNAGPGRFKKDAMKNPEGCRNRLHDGLNGRLSKPW